MLSGVLKQLALDLGAAGVGVGGVEPYGEVAETLSRHKATGLSASLGFTYTDPTGATDVGVTFPWAQSVVTVASAYLPSAGRPEPRTAGTARIARFAERDHYRDLQRILEAVARRLRTDGHRTLILSDDSRLVDRAAAVRSGVGWWGKNTMVLVPGAGPWVLLGSVVTDCPLDRDEPMVRTCGACSACLPACPTGALVEPGVLDARLCLAYWLQAPGVIPRHIRPLVGDRLYGCDDCIEACPPGGRLVQLATAPKGRVDVFDILTSDDSALLARFEHHYIPARNARFLRRNALVVAGNDGGSTAGDLVVAFVGHPDQLLRLHAAWALGAIGGTLARAALETARRDERDDAVRDEIDASLQTI